MNKSWRDIARPIIAKVIRENKDGEEKVIRKALKEAYPFGTRKYHPYKVWLDEIKVQLGKRRFGKRTQQYNPNQNKLF